MWVKGEVKSTESVPFERAIRASEAGLKDMSYTVVGKTEDAVKAIIRQYAETR